jgi:hypothetical protein
MHKTTPTVTPNPETAGTALQHKKKMGEMLQIVSFKGKLELAYSSLWKLEMPHHSESCADIGHLEASVTITVLFVCSPSSLTQKTLSPASGSL